MAAAAEASGGDAKRARVEGTMPPDLRDKIEKSLEALGQVEQKKRSHKKKGPVQPKTRPVEDLEHKKTETVRTGQTSRVHYRCSNPQCKEPIRNDKSADGASQRPNNRQASDGEAVILLAKLSVNRWDTHVIKFSTD